MTGRLAGRKALVTGSANGIGRAIAARFVAEGADTILSDIDGVAAEEAASELNASGEGYGRAIASACDVSLGQDVTALFQLAEREFGELDVLVNNAGLNVRGDFRHMSDSDWERIREVNLDGVVRIARDGFDLLRKSETACLINLASIMGHRGLRQLAGDAAT